MKAVVSIVVMCCLLAGASQLIAGEEDNMVVIHGHITPMRAEIGNGQWNLTIEVTGSYTDERTGKMVFKKLGQSSMTAGPDGYFKFVYPPICDYTATIFVRVHGGWGYHDGSFSLSSSACRRPGAHHANISMQRKF